MMDQQRFETTSSQLLSFCFDPCEFPRGVLNE